MSKIAKKLKKSCFNVIYEEFRCPNTIILVTDPLDGPHLFKTEKEAKVTMKKWHKEALKNGDYDSYWEMGGPFVYKFDREIKLKFEKDK